MPKRGRTRLDGHSLADLQAELVRQHQQRVAECKAAVAAATRRLAKAEADLKGVTTQFGRVGRTRPSGKTTGVPVHGNAVRPDTTLREAVLEIIQDSRKPIRTIEVKARAATLGYSVASVSTLIKFHAQRGAIRQVQHGWWERA